MEELRLKTATHDRIWHLSQANWAVDQDAGKIVFTMPDGTTATAPVQIVGTYNKDDGSWLWAWDHPSVQLPLREHASAVRAFGQTHGIADLTMRKLDCTTDRAWEFTALACHFNEAQGAYCGPAGSALVFMTFGAISLEKKSAQSTRGAKEFRPIAGLTKIDAPDALQFLHEYFALQYEIERAFHEAPKEKITGAIAKPAIAKKKDVYHRYWRCDEDDCLPRSIGWPSDYDLSRTSNWRIFQLGNDSYRIAYAVDRLEYAYDVKRFEDGLKIIDHLFE
jgi:hypothetical protein